MLLSKVPDLVGTFLVMMQGGGDLPIRENQLCWLYFCILSNNYCFGSKLKVLKLECSFYGIRPFIFVLQGLYDDTA